MYMHTTTSELVTERFQKYDGMVISSCIFVNITGSLAPTSKEEL